MVDSIARQYQEQARRQGQDISTTTDDRTFAGGLRHITSVLPSLMNDILQHAPDSQKVCIKLLKHRNVRKYTLFKNTHSFHMSVSSVAYSLIVPFPFSVDMMTECEPVGQDKEIVRYLATIKDIS